MIGRKKLAETCVPAERARRKTVIRREVLAAGRIQLVVATDFARTRYGFFFSGKAARQPSLATLARVVDEGRAETRETHNFVRLQRSEEHTSELQSQSNLVCRLLLETKT